MKYLQSTVLAALFAWSNFAEARNRGLKGFLLDPEKLKNNDIENKGNAYGKYKGDKDPKTKSKTIKDRAAKPIRDEYMIELNIDVNGRRRMKDVKAEFEEAIDSICAPGTGLGTASLRVWEEEGEYLYDMKGSPKCIEAVCDRKDIIKNCEENFIIDLDEDADSLPWGLDRIDQGPGSRPLDGNFFMRNEPYSNYNGADVHVWIIDTGLDGHHEQFQGRILGGKDYLSGESETHARVNNDGNSHGTHVTGTCCGKTMGVAGGVWIHPVKVFNNNGYASASNVRRALSWIRNKHRNNYNSEKGVVNMSFSSGGTSDNIFHRVDRLYNEVNLIPVASAGNSGDNSCERTPAGASRALTVAASEDNDSWFSPSSHGPCVNIIAPGSDILSSVPGGGYDTKSGTSMAAPHLSGALALVIDEKNRFGPIETNTGKGSIFQRIENKAQVGSVADAPSCTTDLLLNINIHKGRVNVWGKFVSPSRFI